MTPAQRHMGRVARIGCIICAHMGMGETPAVVHHLEEETGAAQRQDDFLTIPLCPEHHVGPSGVHKLKKDGIYRRYKASELDFLAMTLRRVYGGVR